MIPADDATTTTTRILQTPQTTERPKTFTLCSPTRYTLKRMATEHPDSADLSIIYIQAGRNVSAPTVSETVAYAGAIDDTVIVEQHRRGVRIITPTNRVADITAIFDDEGYTIIGPLPHDDP